MTNYFLWFILLLDGIRGNTQGFSQESWNRDPEYYRDDFATDPGEFYDGKVFEDAEEMEYFYPGITQAGYRVIFQPRSELSAKVSGEDYSSGDLPEIYLTRLPADKFQPKYNGSLVIPYGQGLGELPASKSGGMAGMRLPTSRSTVLADYPPTHSLADLSELQSQSIKFRMYGPYEVFKVNPEISGSRKVNRIVKAGRRLEHSQQVKNSFIEEDITEKTLKPQDELAETYTVFQETETTNDQTMFETENEDATEAMILKDIEENIQLFSDTIDLEAMDRVMEQVIISDNMDVGNDTIELQNNNTYQNIVRDEAWVVPIWTVGGVTTLLLVLKILHMVALYKTVPLGLDLVLLLGLVSCSVMAMIFTLYPTKTTCDFVVLGSGLAYSLVYSTLFVKTVFLFLLQRGMMLKHLQQAFLLFGAVLVQVVLTLQWIGSSHQTCSIPITQQFLAQAYNCLLIVITFLLSVKCVCMREKYRDSLYLCLCMGLTLCIWITWGASANNLPYESQDLCSALALIINTVAIFIVCFILKFSKLSSHCVDMESVMTEPASNFSILSAGHTIDDSSSETDIYQSHSSKSSDYADDIYQKKEDFTDRFPFMTKPPKFLSRLKSGGESSSKGSRHSASSRQTGRPSGSQLPPGSRPSPTNPNVHFSAPEEMTKSIIY